jgi:hypothetical protein
MADKNTLVLQSCTDVQSVECGLCSEGGVQSADGSSSVVSFKIEEEDIQIKGEEEEIQIKDEEEEIQIKQEEDPFAIRISSVKDEPEVSPQTFNQYIGLLSVILPVCLPAFTHKSAHCGKWKWSVYI